MKQIETFIQSHIDNHSLLGTAVAILQDGKIVYTGGFGTTSVAENSVPITTQTLFGYGSIGKNVCALLIMRLVEQGLLELDVPILNYLPKLRFSNVDYGNRVTLRHLLSHTSGLPAAGKEFGPRDPDSLQRFVFEQIPLYTFLAEPGTVHLYASTVICVAGHIAEVVTGKYYDDLVNEFVFKPLEMRQATFDPTVAMTYSVALPHEEGLNEELCVTHRMCYNVSGNPSSFGYASVSDLANMAQMYLNRGKFNDQVFLKPSSVKEMQKMHTSRHIETVINPQSDNYLGYGLGFEIGNYRGKRTAGHGGIQLSYDCFYKLFPDEKSGVIVLTNYSKDWRPVWQMVMSLYARALNLREPDEVSLDEKRPKSIPLGEDTLQHYEGAFLNIEMADLASFTISNKQLLLRRSNREPIQLDAVGNNQFCAELPDGNLLPVEFVNNEDGEIAHLMLEGEPYFWINLNSDFQPNLEIWKTFEGVYKDPSNNDLDDILSVKVEKDRLFITEGTREVAGPAISNNCFLSEIGLIEFEDSGHNEAKILVLGKAVRYYPINEALYRMNHVVQYMIDVPQKIY